MKAALLALALAAGAAAQPLTLAPAPPPDDVSPGAAVGLSILAPVALVAAGAALGDAGGSLSIVLVAGGVFVGPSAGNLAQGDWTEAAVGTGLRVAGATAAYVSFGRWLSKSDPNALDVALGVGGTGMFIGGVVYDLVTAGRGSRDAPVSVEPRGAGLAVRVAL